jgi:pimeloyl-ACP methyl ester carboxylesterase
MIASSFVTAKGTRRQLLLFFGTFVLMAHSTRAAPVHQQQSNRKVQLETPKRTKEKWLNLPPTPRLPDTTESGVARINGTSIYYAQFGKGPSAILLHGGMANSNYWGFQVRHLAQNFRVTVMDTRGHGKSPVTSRLFSYRTFSQDVLALLNFLNIAQTSVVGWSDGAITGLQLAMASPDRVSKLFAFGANSSPGGLKPNGARSQTFVEFATRCKSEYLSLSPRPERWPELIEGLRTMWHREPRFTPQELHQIRVPTSIADGEYDEIIKRHHTEEIALAIPMARLAILPRVSHFAMLQDPVEFNQKLANFLTT